MSRHVFLGEYRPPVYPYFLHVASVPFAPIKLHSITANTELFFRSVANIQSLSGVIGIIIILWIIWKMGTPLLIFLPVGLLYIFHPVMTLFDRYILTESFSAFWVCVYLLLLWRVSVKLTPLRFIPFIIWGYISLFIRIDMLPMPLAGYVMFYIRYRTRRSLAVALFGLLSFALIVVSWISLNGSLYNYYGLTRISDINLLGKVLEYDLPVSEVKQTYWTDVIEKYRLTNNDLNPWSLLQDKTVNYLNLNTLGPDMVSVISHSWLKYARGVFSLSYGIMRKSSTSGGGSSREQIESSHVLLMPFFIYQALWLLRLVNFLIFPYALYKAIRHPSTKSVYVLALSSFLAIYVIMVAALGYDGFARISGLLNHLYSL